MKRFLTTVTFIAIIFVGGLIGTYEHTYEIEAEVTQVYSDYVSFTDTTGNTYDWTLEEGEHYRLGDTVELNMFDGFTDSYRRDDKIETVKYIE